MVQIQDFTSGFWGGTKLACWLKGETPWRFFPKLSIYLRATNTSQSFKISILPQVTTNVPHVSPCVLLFAYSNQHPPSCYEL